MNPIKPNGHGHRLPIGVNLPAPINHVSERLLDEIAVVLLQITKHPSQCISRKDLLDCADKAIAKTYILEQRLKIMERYVDSFLKEAAEFPKEDPTAGVVIQMCNNLKKVIAGDY